ncbi:MAG: hypothetical protein WCT26_03715 [Candidatus Buchananbacteria bacterium]|jgi:hypothetical protein
MSDSMIVTDYSLTFKIGKAEDFLIYAEAIARIIDCWQGQLIEAPHKGPDCFLLGNSNDWWLRRGNQPNEIIISRRWQDLELMKSLRYLLIKLLDLQRFNNEG